LNPLWFLDESEEGSLFFGPPGVKAEADALAWFVGLEVDHLGVEREGWGARELQVEAAALAFKQRGGARDEGASLAEVALVLDTERVPVSKGEEQVTGVLGHR
jgi:hypothetical protein